MNLFNVDDILKLSVSEIKELIEVHEHELNQGYLVNQEGQKEAVDKVRYKAILDALEQATKLKSCH